MSRPTSRRRLFGAAAAASIVAATAATGAVDVAADPVVGLHGQYLEVRCQDQAVHAQFGVLRAALVAKFGAPRGSVTADDLWGNDPRYPTLSKLMDECNASGDRLLEAQDAVLEAVPTTAAGLRAKVLVTLDMAPPKIDDYSNRKAYETLREVATWLAGRSAGMEA